jgi:hypothetical protein
MEKLEDRLNKILSSFNINTYIQPGEAILLSDILEVRCIGFIYMSWFLIKNSAQYLENEESIFPFSVIVSLQRLIKIIEKYIGYNVSNPREKMEFSNRLVIDLTCLEKQLVDIYKFNGVSLYQYASQLILGCPLDYYLPKQYHNAFEHQKLVSKEILDIENIKNGFIMFYRTMTNSGKTSSIINIAAVVDQIRSKYAPVFSNLQVIATCDVKPVLTRWGQLLYHAGYPFGIASKRYYPSNPEIAAKIKEKAKKECAADPDCVDEYMRFSNSDTCKSITERLVIICAPDIAVKILTQASNSSKRFILLHDEPTMYAGAIDSPQLHINMEVMKKAPKWSIFSSATLPYDPIKTEIFVNHHKTRFPNAKFDIPDLSEYPNVEIIRCGDYGSATKFLPMMLIDEVKNDDNIIIIDLRCFTYIFITLI